MENFMSNIRKINRMIISKERIKEEDVKQFIEAFIHIIEDYNLVKKYPILDFYCNIVMDFNCKKEILNRILEKIGNVFLEIDDVVIDNEDIDIKLSEVICLKELRHEILDLLQYLNVDEGEMIFNNQLNWRAFVRKLFLLMENKHLNFSDDMNKLIINHFIQVGIIEKELKGIHLQFVITNLHEIQNSPFVWQISLKEDNKVLGKGFLHLTENKKAFSN